jgi:hypothetical protein
MTKSQQAIRDLVKAIRDLTGNLPPPGVLKIVATDTKQDAA